MVDLQATLQKNKSNIAYNDQTWQHCIQKKKQAQHGFRLDLAQGSGHDDLVGHSQSQCDFKSVQQEAKKVASSSFGT